MNSEIKKVLLTLAILIGLIGTVNLLCVAFCSDRVINITTPILYFLYSFTPLISLSILGGGIFKRVASKYLSFKTINYTRAILVILKIIVLLPILSLVFIYLGNILGIGGFGVISTATIAVALSAIPMYLLMGLTYYAVIAFGGEFLWRGFLENLTMSNATIKHLAIGLIWWIWYFASIVFFRINYEWSSLIIEGIITFALYLLLSIYLAKVVQKTGTILGSSLIMGLLSSSSILYGGVENSNWMIVGNNSIVTILVISTFLLAITPISKNTKIF